MPGSRGSGVTDGASKADARPIGAVKNSCSYKPGSSNVDLQPWMCIPRRVSNGGAWQPYYGLFSKHEAQEPVLT